jgi:hypothetical protein
MSVVGKIINEWAFRCKKGYPDMNNPDDMRILKEIYSEYGIVLEEAREEQNTDDEVNFNNIPLPQEDIEAIKNIYNALSESQQQAFNKHFRKYSLSQFIVNSKNLAEVFGPFFEISKKKGRGRGEFIPLLAISNSKSGGTEDKDIIVGSDIMEVKELDKTKKFLTGKSGSIRKSKFSRAIETFCKYLDDLQIKPGTNELVDKVLGYYEQEYVSSNVSETFIQNIIKVSRELNTIATGNITQDTEYIKIGDRRYEIPQKEGGYLPGDTLTIGKEVQSTEISLQKLKKHEITKDPEILYIYFNEIVDKYLSQIGYFCIYKAEGVNSIEVYSNVKLKTALRTNYVSVVQGNVRLQIMK